MSAQTTPDDDPHWWRAEAVCRPGGGIPPSTWYPDDEAGEARAKMFCRTCPVMVECLGYALNNSEPDGIWGGTNVDERGAMLGGRIRAPRLGRVNA